MLLTFSLLSKIMAKLTVDLATSADVLGTTPDRFLAWLKREDLHSLHLESWLISWRNPI